MTRNKGIIGALSAFAILMVSLSVYGGFRAYSPVPYWDMWDGTVQFYMQAHNGDPSAWWGLHNEHRIILARLLFWIDLDWLSGQNWFLVLINYVLASAGLLLFWRILRNFSATDRPSAGEIVLGLMLTGWMFLWSQQENFTWGFQSQFFLAQLLPLCALYWLHKSLGSSHPGRDFLLACAFGIASAGTMANGILALPLMTGYALVTRQRWLRIGILATLCVLVLVLYFHNYHTPENHGSLTQALKTRAWGLPVYTLLYIGSPFYFIFGKATFGIAMALGAGLAFVAALAWHVWKSRRDILYSSLTLALLFFILYIGGTALGTASGRLIFGFKGALAGRYTTPAIMAWAALLVLYSPAILASAASLRRKKFLIPIFAAALLMLPLQFTALRSHNAMQFDRNAGALALELGVKDARQVIHIYPVIDRVLRIAQEASAQDISIFGAYPFNGLRERLGSVAAQQASAPCRGDMEKAESIEGEDRFIRVDGWLTGTDRQTPAFITFVDSQGRIAGYAVTGGSWPASAASDRQADANRYRGYVMAANAGTEIQVRAEQPVCQMTLAIPPASSPPPAEKH